MELIQFREYVQNTFGANGTGGIDGSELQFALLDIADRMATLTGWQPVFAIVGNGASQVVKITDWLNEQGVKPAVGQYLGSSGFVTDINQAVNIRGPQGIQGIPGNGLVNANTLPTDGLDPIRYYLICQMGGNQEFAVIDFVGKALDTPAHNPVRIRLYVANRGGFYFSYTMSGPVDQNIGLICTRSPGGTLYVFAKSTDQYKTLTARVTDNYTTFIQSALVGQNTLNFPVVFDTTQPATYRPLSYTNDRNQWFSVGNGLGSVPFTQNAGTAGLALASNLIAGSTDLALVNTNLNVGNGISFWQMLTATTQRLLFYLRGDGNVGIGTATPRTPLDVPGSVTMCTDPITALAIGQLGAYEKVDVNGRVRTLGLVAAGNLPSIAKGAGCNAASLQTNSTDMAGAVTITTTSGQSASAVLATITFVNAYARTPKVIISAMNEAAAGNSARVYAKAISTSQFALYVGSSALDNSQSYEFSYLIIA